MKTKTMYVADDGTLFNSMQECIAYEKSANKYIVSFLNKKGIGTKREFASEAEAKRFIADTLHICFNGGFTRTVKLSHLGTVVEFKSTELSEVVPAHLKINGNKLNEIFQMCATKNVKIKGYTLHGDYYLSDKVITNTTWKETCEMKEEITLPNGKKVIAHILSKEELETIPQEERKCDKWYWTSTHYFEYLEWTVDDDGSFISAVFGSRYGNGGARLGFKNPFIN